jgi:23S rRNA (uracil1939-C5)-methyltransferase
MEMEMEKDMGNETIELSVEDVVYRGKGLGRHDGMVVFVPATLKGERVEVELTVRRKRHAEGRLLRVLEASPRRVAPICPLFGLCPGCAYQHASYEEEVRVKQAQLLGFLNRTRAWDERSVMDEFVPSPQELGYRNKIVLHTGADASGQACLGYVGEDNHTLLDVAECPLALPLVNRRLAEFRTREFLAQTLPPGEDVTFRHTAEDGTLVWIGRQSPGKERLTEHSPWGPMRVPRTGFFQVNPLLVPALVERVGAQLGSAGCDTALDLYCGCGLLSLAALHAGIGRVIGVDSDPRAIRFAEANARKLAPGEALFRTGRAHEWLPDILKGVAQTRCALIVDPPRRGLDPVTARQIGASSLPALLYVSCAADTLARDLNLLAPSGFRVRSAQGFDMFARTPYFESVVLLTR